MNPLKIGKWLAKKAWSLFYSFVSETLGEVRKSCVAAVAAVVFGIIMAYLAVTNAEEIQRILEKLPDFG